jgi:tRNA threonylcarbamoyladenosine biosynthesis protein TsaB
MVLVIDTSSARSAVAVLDDELRPVAEAIADSGPGYDIEGEVERLVPLDQVAVIAVATGPGSFTGLRVGASFAVGLALGLGLGLRPLGTLELQAARAREPAAGLAEAGRGRVYCLDPGSAPRLAEASGLRRDLPAVGWLRPATAAALTQAGVRLLGDDELRTFGEAAAELLPAAAEIPCDSLRLEYLNSNS